MEAPEGGRPLSTRSTSSGDRTMDTQATKIYIRRTRTGSLKAQATSTRNQQASRGSSTVDQGPWTPDSQAKPLLTSSWIMDPGKSFMVQGPRAFTKINVFLGCVI